MIERSIPSKTGRIILRSLFPIILAPLFFAANGVVWSSPAIAVPLEKAYALNQEAMVEMSMAQFNAAAEMFIQAAALVPDYGIKGRSLVYTPNFMAAWAFEKIGNRSQACRYFKRFLEIALPEDREETKGLHAEEFLSKNCGL